MLLPSAGGIIHLKAIFLVADIFKSQWTDKKRPQFSIYTFYI